MWEYKNAPGRSRTCDPGVISTMLYRLSYESLHYIRGKRESIDKWINKERKKERNKETKKENKRRINKQRKQETNKQTKKERKKQTNKENRGTI